MVFWVEDAEAETDPVFGEGARGCIGRAVCVRSVHNVRDNISGRGHARYLVGTEGVATDVISVSAAFCDELSVISEVFDLTEEFETLLDTGRYLHK